MKMMPILILMGMTLSATGAEVITANSPDSLVLENQVLRIDISRTPAPFIRRLVHKASGRAIVNRSRSGSLFSITYADADGKRKTIESAAAGCSNARITKAGTASTVAIQYSRFPASDLAVDVTAVCYQQDPLTRWTMRITHNPRWRVKLVRFPELLAVPTIADGKDDCLVLPALDGTLIENPAENWRNGQSVTLAYPGSLSAQFLAYQDQSTGVYLAGMDGTGYPMSLGVSKQADGFRCWHEFTAVADGKEFSPGIWQSPYPVAIGVTQGTWCDTADQYKRWAVRQTWCAKTLAQRHDIPAWWKDGPDVHVCSVRTYDKRRICTGSYYPQLDNHLQHFRDKIDGTVVAMLADWENHRRWTGGDYFPIFDVRQARPTIQQLRQDGFRPFFFLSGLYFTYWNEGRDGGEISAAQKYLASYVIAEGSGRPREYLLDESNASDIWKRHSYQFCVGAPTTKAFFCGVIDRAHALGVDVLQMDQTVSGAGDACYCTTHDHKPGVGLYQSCEFWDLLDTMRGYGKARSPDFALFHEEPHEQLIPHVDGFHVREYLERRWYRGYPGAIGIPLFSYLYHEFAEGYGGDSASLSKDNSRWNVRSHAMNLVAGRTPGGSIWSAHQNMYNCAFGPDHNDPQPLPPVEDAGEGLPHPRQDVASVRSGGTAGRNQSSSPTRW